jgi:hypothetical protein
MLKEAAAVPRELFLGKLILLGCEPPQYYRIFGASLARVAYLWSRSAWGDMQELLSLDKSPPLEQDSAAVGHL